MSQIENGPVEANSSQAPSLQEANSSAAQAVNDDLGNLNEGLSNQEMLQIGSISIPNFDASDQEIEEWKQSILSNPEDFYANYWQEFERIDNENYDIFNQFANYPSSEDWGKRDQFLWMDALWRDLTSSYKESPKEYFQERVSNLKRNYDLKFMAVNESYETFVLEVNKLEQVFTQKLTVVSDKVASGEISKTSELYGNLSFKELQESYFTNSYVLEIIVETLRNQATEIRQKEEKIKLAEDLIQSIRERYKKAKRSVETL